MLNIIYMYHICLSSISQALGVFDAASIRTWATDGTHLFTGEVCNKVPEKNKNTSTKYRKTVHTMSCL